MSIHPSLEYVGQRNSKIAHQVIDQLHHGNAFLVFPLLCHYLNTNGHAFTTNFRVLNLLCNYVIPSVVGVADVSASGLFGKYLCHRHNTSGVVNKVEHVIIVVNSPQLLYIFYLKCAVV